MFKSRHMYLIRNFLIDYLLFCTFLTVKSAESALGNT